ncbi:alpha/beta-hydrolase, partial [Basidiobolus meristosporus CBS 931.73]
ESYVNQIVVELPQGKYQGLAYKAHQAFLNIPYAQAPVGELRWKKPQKLQLGATELFDATKTGPSCPQPKALIATFPGISDFVPDQDEDNCLNLNIWTPPSATKPKEGWPVMVWIHGGSLKDGANSLPIYDGTRLVQAKPVVVVVINYRLNVFGFLASKELAEDSEDGSAGNYGFLDQRLAFEWVKENISYFGGDSTRICGFGESAGSVSLAHHLVISRGLFQRAILQSGGLDTLPAATMEKQQIIFDEICKQLTITGDDKVAQLRKVSSEKLIDTIVAVSEKRYLLWVGTIDGATIKQSPRLLYQNPDNFDPFVKDIIIGENTDEGSIFLAGFGKLETYRANLEAVFPAKIVPTIESLYPLDSFEGSVMLAGAKIYGDRIFVHPIRDNACDLVRGGPSRKVYFYRFNSPLEKTAHLNLGIHHAVEIPFVFNQVDYLNEAEKKLAQRITEYWVNFASHGVPGEDWEPLTDGNGVSLVFESGGRVEKEPMQDSVRDSRISFWKSLHSA